MTVPTPSRDRPPRGSRSGTGPSDPAARERTRRGIAAAVRRIAFWTAIAAPLLIVPAVLAGGINSHAYAVFGLLVLDIVCLVAGHEHRPRDR